MSANGTSRRRSVGTTPPIAIVGMACRYPGARTPVELWENVLACRRAFRRIPNQRLSMDDYYSPDPNAPDRTYADQAAVIEDYEFDRLAFRVAGTTHRSADPAHWLALDVAAQAIADAGFGEGRDLPRQTTGVILGNTLTGEFSRANTLRLRWPYVRRVVDAALAEQGQSPQDRRDFLANLEKSYKKPFPAVGAETLAGGLSNTIAGRICNHFDLGGGGYTVDGACSASLLAITNACVALISGDLDVALAGGVDLSLDPFELVGFAKTGALAPEEMRIYDVDSAGFWPGEGCGFVTLMRLDQAKAERRRIYAVLRGWGISSDGSGGLTRPEVDGQLLSLQRAYSRAGFGVDTIGYFEGHGTGTAVGDTTELRTLSRARRQADASAPPAALGSIKANIGHTKAAAGLAGLIKAAMALHQQVIPPTTGCRTPHAELTGDAPALRIVRQGHVWPDDVPLRAAVSAMGFGGINTHVVLESATRRRRRTIRPSDRPAIASSQDAELFLFDADSTARLESELEKIHRLSAGLSRSELIDLAAALAKRLQGRAYRAAVVAIDPVGLETVLNNVIGRLRDGQTDGIDADAGLFLGTGSARPRIGFLFPGQGSPAHLGGGAWRRRFDRVNKLYASTDWPAGGDGVATQVAQPAIVTAAAAGLVVLSRLGVKACVGIGHSLGELAAYHWAGAFDSPTLVRIAAARGQAMASLGNPTGAMASLATGPDAADALIDGQPVALAGLNGPDQTVIAGPADAIDTVVARATAAGCRATRLPVSHAFHSPLVAAAQPVLARTLADESVRPLRRRVISTITGAALDPDENLRDLLCRQVTSPVRFTEALATAASRLDLLIEVGPGYVLTGLAAHMTDVPALALDAAGPSLTGLLNVVGAAFVLGAPVRARALFDDRLTRPIDLERLPRFLANPCELAPASDHATVVECEVDCAHDKLTDSAGPSTAIQGDSPLDVIRRLVAERSELPISAVHDDHRLLSDLHLNSITVGQVVVDAARALGLPAPIAPTEYADATLNEVARALTEGAELAGSATSDDRASVPAGVDSWVRTFTTEWVERPRRNHPSASGSPGSWRVIATDDCGLAESIDQRFGEAEGGGIVVCLPAAFDESHVDVLLRGARMLAEEQADRFVLVQPGAAAAAFVRTLHLERPDVATCVVDVPEACDDAAGWVLAEARSAQGYTECRYDSAGRRFEPVLRVVPGGVDSDTLPLDETDVLLVTGGGKGIAAECALDLARRTGVRLALLGRSEPDKDRELADNLERLTAAGAQVEYIAADVTDAAAVRRAVDRVRERWGPVTAVLHAAGINVPQRLETLDRAACLRTLAPKVQGVRNVLAAIDPAELKLLVSFGSIIARVGLAGEADYALANAWLARLTEQWQQAHPHCRCLAVEWSVWSGVGMGQRLGRVDALLREGITPITPEVGVETLRRLIAAPQSNVTVVATGRFGRPPTVRLEEPALPMARFLERPRVHYPGIELVADAVVSAETDPYLNDHVLQGQRVLPAVIALEAMAQIASALSGASRPLAFENVAFDRPIVVPEGEPITVRVAGLVRDADRIDLVVRCEATGFQVDHFRATCSFAPIRDDRVAVAASMKAGSTDAAPIDIVPERDLYGDLLFHTGRFRCLRAYRHLTATECIAEIDVAEPSGWFGAYLPGALLLGDPAARDATIHAVQACIPHARVLPTGVERILLFGRLTPGETVTVHARQRWQKDDTFLYDIDVVTPDGKVVERWIGLRLQRVEAISPAGGWSPALLGPLLERRVGELMPDAQVTAAVERNGHGRPARSDRVIRRVLGNGAPVRRRPDGKPELGNGHAVSVAHAGSLTLAVVGIDPLGCDLETVEDRGPDTWKDLLGPDRVALARAICNDLDEDPAAASTRVWAAVECLKKAGRAPDTPLTLVSTDPDGCVILGNGSIRTLTLVTRVRGVSKPLVLAVLTGGGHAGV